MTHTYTPFFAGFRPGLGAKLMSARSMLGVPGRLFFELDVTSSGLDNAARPWMGRHGDAAPMATAATRPLHGRLDEHSLFGA